MLGSDSMVVAMFMRAGLLRKDPRAMPPGPPMPPILGNIPGNPPATNQRLVLIYTLTNQKSVMFCIDQSEINIICSEISTWTTNTDS